METIFEYTKKTRDEYRSQTIEVAPGYDFSQYETLRTVELYHNSRFLTGNKDSLKREKPFYNITKFRVNVATRATDLDTKDVHIESERADTDSYAQSFVLNLRNRNWMKDSKLAQFLNKMGSTRSKYGGVVVKKIEVDGELSLHVVPWRDLITDQVDIRNGVKIERHYYTPAQLRTDAPKGWTNIDEAIKAGSKKSQKSDATGQQVENRTPGEYIEVYEVHGVLKTCYLRGEKYGDDYGDDDTYERQMHVIVLDETDKDNVTGIALFQGKEDDDPYKYLPWEEVDGRGLGIGVVEDCFEAQVWTNWGVKAKKDMLELAGKILFNTTDKNVAAKNVLTDLEVGSIIKTDKDTTLTQVNNSPTSYPAFSELMEAWNQQAENATSTYQAITGDTMPSGTPFRLMATLNREAGSMFVYRRQEAGLFLQEIYQDWVLPWLVGQMKGVKNLVSTLQGEELEMVANALAQAESFKFAKDNILSGKAVYPDNVQQVFDKTRQMHLNGGLRRQFKFPDNMFDDWKGSVDVITTGEQENKDTMLETLFNLFQVVAKFPQVLQDPVMAKLFNQMVETAGVSPLLFGGRNPGGPAAPQPAQPVQPQPQAQPQPMPTSLAAPVANAA